MDGCTVIMLSPLEVHFSQTRISPEFKDGRSLQETLAQIEVADLGALPSRQDQGGDARESAAAVTANANANGAGTTAASAFELRVPFPRIEVTRWRCKLRDADGRPKLDARTGLQLYCEEERWFSLDNRRLCCMQQAAARVWPAEALCEVVEIPATLARMRELRKFDTKTFGCSVLIGRRDDTEPQNWCWRTEVGLPIEEQPGRGVAWQSTRRRKRRVVAGQRSSHQEDDDENAEPMGTAQEFLQNIILFFFVYLLLRIVMSLLRWLGVVSWGGASAQIPAQDALDLLMPSPSTINNNLSLHHEA